MEYTSSNRLNEVGLIGLCRSQKRAPQLSKSTLTAREREIVEYVRQGKFYKELECEAHITLDVAKIYVRRICKKLGLANRTALSAYATEELFQRQKSTQHGDSDSALKRDPLFVCGGKPLDQVRLNSRSKQIVGLLRQGKTNKQIAQELQLSLTCVRNCLALIYKKLQVGSRTQVAILASAERCLRGAQTPTLAGLPDWVLTSDVSFEKIEVALIPAFRSGYVPNRLSYGRRNALARDTAALLGRFRESPRSRPKRTICLTDRQLLGPPRDGSGEISGITKV